MTNAARIPARGGLDTRSAWVLAGVLVAALAVFARALGGELVYDDALLVARNPDLGSLASVPRFFARPYWGFLDPEARLGFWRPLTATALALGHALGGGRPWGFHAIGLSAHLAQCAAAFLLVRRATGERRLAGLCALLFALHPVQVEGVAWISALNDPLAAALTLLAAWSWLGWRQEGSRGLPLAAGAWVLAALLTKESGLVALGFAFLLDVLLERGAPAFPRGSNARGWSVLGAAVGIWVLARMAVFRSPLAGFDLVATHLGVGAGRLALLRLELFGGALRLLAWPAGLTPFRPFRPDLTLADREALVAALATLGFAALLALALVRRAPRMTLALALVPASLAIVLVRVESLGIFPLSDRFVALAALGFALAVALALLRLGPRAGTALGLLLAGAWGAASVQRIGAWHDELALFRDAAAKAPRSPYVQWGLGRVLLDRYQASADPALLDQAEAAFVRAQDLLVASREPGTDVLAGPSDFLQANLGYGWARLLQDQRSGYRGSTVALGIFEELAERVLALEARRAEARQAGTAVPNDPLELEQVHTAIGAARMQLGRLDEAEAALRAAVERNPRYPEAHQNLGRLYARRKQWELALRHFERAAALRPGDPEDHLLVAQACAELGRHERAEELARGLQGELPGAEPACLLARIAIGRGDAALALRWSERALAADGEDARAWYLRGQALILADQPGAAVTALERSGELAPDAFDAAYDLGVLLTRQERWEEAARALVRAYELCVDESLREPLRRTLEQLPDVPPAALRRLSASDARRLDNEGALRWLERALARAPDDGETLLQQARLFRRLERHDEGLELMRRACERLPRSFPAQAELGAWLSERGRAREARAALERAAALGPPPEWPPEIATEALAELDRRLQALPADGG